MRLFIMIFLSILFEVTLIASNETGKYPLSSIFSFIKDHEKYFQLGNERQFTLFLGITGSGKTTAIKLLTGENLESKEIALGQYIFSDNNVKIGEKTIESKTIIPELMIESKTGAIYADCPGFKDTRSVLHDITVTYFINRLLHSAHSVKLVFVVNSWSVQSSGGQRNEFYEILQQTVSLISGIEKFDNGIALVVTKIDNKYKRGHLIGDDAEIESIAQFLKEMLIHLYEKIDTNIGKIIKIIKMFLEKNGNKYKRIGIIRKPDDSGLVKNMQIFQNGIDHINDIIARNSFIEVQESDFSYTLSSESKILVRDSIDKIDENLVHKVSKIVDKIKKFYSDQTDVKLLYQNIFNGYEIFSKIKKTDNVTSYVHDFILAAKNLNVNLLGDNDSSAKSNEKLVFERIAPAENVPKIQSPDDNLIELNEVSFESNTRTTNSPKMHLSVNKDNLEKSNEILPEAPTASMPNFPGVQLSVDNPDELYNEIRLSEFLKLMSDVKVPLKAQIQNKFDGLVQYLNEMKKNIGDVIDKIDRNILSDVSTIANNINQFYSKQQKAMADVKSFYQNIFTGYNKLHEIQTCDNLTSYVKDFVSVANLLKIPLLIDNQEKLLNNIELSKFLKSLSNNSVTIKPQIENKFNEMIQYIDEMKNRVGDAIEKIDRNVLKDVSTIADHIKKFYSKNTDLKQFYQNLFVGYEKFISIKKSNNITSYVNVFILAAKSFNINLSVDNLEKMLNDIESSSFLKLLSNTNDPLKAQVESEFDEIIRYIGELKSHIRDAIETIDQNVLSKVSTISNDIEQFFAKQEQIDIKQFQQNIFNGYKKFNEIKKSENPTLYIKEFISVAKSLNINLSVDYFEKMFNDIELSEYFKSLSNISLPTKTKIEGKFDGMIKNLSDSETWYEFLTNLDNLNAQEIASNWQEIAKQSHYPTTMADFLRIIRKCNDPSIYAKLEKVHMTNIDQNKMRAFQTAVQHLIKYDGDVSICSSNLFRITGNNIRISDVIKNGCWSTAKQIEIFASNRVYFDADMNKSGQRSTIAIIAPIWEIGSATSILLDGANGPSHSNYKADDAFLSNESEDGEPGLPGLPGQSAGNFLGIGETFKNAHSLTIRANGGIGGPGQHGGNGKDGISGNDARLGSYNEGVSLFKGKDYYNLVSSSRISCQNGYWIILVEYKPCTIYGTSAISGTNGGNGGAKGLSGYPGNILVIGLSEKPAIQTSAVKYDYASVDGKGGKGGSATRNGKSISGERRISFLSDTIHKWHDIDGDLVPGAANGIDGGNSYGRQQPQTNEFNDKARIVNSYKSFIRESLSMNVYRNDLEKLLKTIEQNREIKQL